MVVCGRIPLIGVFLRVELHTINRLGLAFKRGDKCQSAIVKSLAQDVEVAVQVSVGAERTWGDSQSMVEPEDRVALSIASQVLREQCVHFAGGG